MRVAVAAPKIGTLLIGSKSCVYCAAIHARFAASGNAICHHALSAVRARICTIAPLFNRPTIVAVALGAARTFNTSAVTTAWAALGIAVGVAAKSAVAGEKAKVRKIARAKKEDLKKMKRK